MRVLELFPSQPRGQLPLLEAAFVMLPLTLFTGSATAKLDNANPVLPRPLGSRSLAHDGIRSLRYIMPLTRRCLRVPLRRVRLVRPRILRVVAVSLVLAVAAGWGLLEMDDICISVSQPRWQLLLAPRHLE